MLNQSNYANYKNKAHGTWTERSTCRSTEVSVLCPSFGPLCNTQGDGLENILATGLQFVFLSFPSYSFVSTIKLHLIFTYRSGSVMATQCVFYAAKTETSNITFTDFRTQTANKNISALYFTLRINTVAANSSTK